ncbi:MAG TPA: hypothetical protein VF711_07995 [Acidimicrobiales bacterium]|jgi:hypothetical protein
MSTDDPRVAPDEVEPGVPATSELTEGQWLSGTADEADMPMLDYPQGVDQWGTTAREEELGESLTQRVKREVPDRLAAEQPYLSQPLVEPGADDVDTLDEEPDLVADLDASASGSLSPEEAAMRVVDELPGASYAPDPGYIDD